MRENEISEQLFALKDLDYKNFNSRLIPTVCEDEIIGVRTPELRKMAKSLDKGTAEQFLKDLPHGFFEENQLHAFIISEIKDFDRCVSELERFLPYIDNWATCDQLSPGVFRKNKEKLLPYIEKWISSDKEYIIRFGIGMLMEHFLGEDFKKDYAECVAEINFDAYYVKMMIAWYFATALAKNWDEIIPFIEGKKLEKWTHNKAIQKSIESRRISAEQKAYLRGLKIK
ncbi:MAG: DNA alkylation repair protein [Candidatus Scatomorpha sp.]